jgi:hypothetical protein
MNNATLPMLPMVLQEPHVVPQIAKMLESEMCVECVEEMAIRVPGVAIKL